MKPITPAILALLLAGSAGLSGLVPAYADDPAPTPPPAAAAPAVPPPAVNPDAQAPAAQTVPPPAVNPDTHAPQGDATPGNATSGKAAPGNGSWAPQGGSAGGRPGGGDAFVFRFGGPQGGSGGSFGGGGGNLGSSVLRLACGDRGAEALEIAFVRIQYEVKPTGAQQPLFNTLKQAALADQKNYADACQAAIASVRGQGQGQPPTMLDRFAARLAVETARVNALNDILPKFRAFFDSLSDQQKAQFQPRRGMFSGNGMGRMGQGDMGPGHMGSGPNGMMGRGMGPGNMGPGNMGHGRPGGMGRGNMGPGNMGPGGFQHRPNGQDGSMPPSGMQRLRPMPAPDGQPDDSQPDGSQPDNSQPDNGQQGVPADPATNDSTPA